MHPATTAAKDGVSFYTVNCSACHGAPGSIDISVADRTSNNISEGISLVPQMNTPAPACADPGPD